VAVAVAAEEVVVGGGVGSTEGWREGMEGKIA
jgi:hypothetical protein